MRASRVVTLALLALLGYVQAHLWVGRGSLGHVHQLATDLRLVSTHNEQRRDGNSRLQAEVADLTDGVEMIEEKARMELGMVGRNEIYVQILPSPAVPAGASAATPQER